MGLKKIKQESTSRVVIYDNANKTLLTFNKFMDSIHYLQKNVNQFLDYQTLIIVSEHFGDTCEYSFDPKSGDLKLIKIRS